MDTKLIISANGPNKSGIVSELSKLKGKQSKTGLNWTPPTTLRPPLPLSISDQLLEQLAGRFQKWNPPTN